MTAADLAITSNGLPWLWLVRQQQALAVMARFKTLLQTLKQARLVVEVGRQKGELSSVADLVDSFLDTPQMEACLERFRADPDGAALLEERYPPLQPDLERMQQLPSNSLGFQYAKLILGQGYDPDFFRPRPVESEAQWLTQRIATTHDIHHVVAGFCTRPEGEAGVLAITAMQIGFPAYVSLTNAAAISRFRLQPESFGEMSQAISHGISLGFGAKTLAAMRWEDGWASRLSNGAMSWGSVIRPTPWPMGWLSSPANASEIAPTAGLVRAPAAEMDAPPSFPTRA